MVLTIGHLNFSMIIYHKCILINNFISKLYINSYNYSFNIIHNVFFTNDMSFWEIICLVLDAWKSVHHIFNIWWKHWTSKFRILMCNCPDWVSDFMSNKIVRNNFLILFYFIAINFTKCIYAHDFAINFTFLIIRKHIIIK